MGNIASIFSGDVFREKNLPRFFTVKKRRKF